MLTLWLAQAAPAVARQDESEPDNGTDPTRTRTAATISFKHGDLPHGLENQSLQLSYAQPIATRTSITVTLPIARTGPGPDDGYAVGDVGLKISSIPWLTRRYGVVLQGEVGFDSARSDGAGAGQTVLKATVIYARFLKGGGILAPSLVQSYGVGPDHDRSRLSTTALDLYYVPRLRDRRFYVTVDPSLTLDWTRDKQAAGLAVTLGRALGPAFGGRAQLYLKPSAQAGGGRSLDWALEVGYKVIGF